MDSDKRALLEERLLGILSGYPGGIRESELIQELMRDGYQEFSKCTIQDSRCLFRSHFSLFHCLYHLRNRLHREKIACLDINSIRITLEPYSSAQEAVACSDPLGNFYLDIRNIEKNSGNAEVLLEQFWTRRTPPRDFARAQA